MARLQGLTPGDETFQQFDEFADLAETLALSIDPDLAKSIENTRRESEKGGLESLDQIRLLFQRRDY